MDLAPGCLDRRIRHCSALAGALACLIPVVGEALAIIIVILVGLMTSVQLSLFTALFALVVLIAMRIWVKPRLFNRGWDNPILTVILLITMADAFGLAGVIVAPPLSVVCQILWSRLVSHRLVSGDAAQLSDIKERQERLKELIAAMDGPPPPLVTSSMERLNHLIGKAEPILQTVPLVESSDPSSQVAPIQNRKNNMAAPKIVNNLALLKQKGLAWARQIDQRTHGRLGVLTGAASQALMPDSVITAAAIAYFAVISLFPLTLLTIAIASFSLGTAMDQNLIIQRLEFIAPALGQLLGQNIDEIIRARGPSDRFCISWSGLVNLNNFLHT